MINIQKYYLVHIGPIRSTLVHSTNFGSIQSTLSYLVLVLFSRHWSYSVLFVPTRFPLVHSVLLVPIRSYSVLLVPIRSYFVHSVHYVPFGPFVCSLRSIQTTSIHLCSLWSILIYFGPFLYTCIQAQGEDMFRLRVIILNPNIYIYKICNI